MSKFRGIFIKLVGMKNKEKNIELKNIRRVLVLGGRIGDMVCETPLIRELHDFKDKNYPNEEINNISVETFKKALEGMKEYEKESNI